MLTVGPGKQVWPAPEQTERQRLSHKQVWAHTPAWSPCFLVMGEHRTSSRKAGLLLLAFHSETSPHLSLNAMVHILWLLTASRHGSSCFIQRGWGGGAGRN